MLTIAMFDGIDDGLAHRNADPVDRILVERRQLPHAIAEDLDEVHHLEEAGDLQPDEAATDRHGRGRIIQ
jgi:hypothetical protein